jgi:hypothetical protein
LVVRLIEIAKVSCENRPRGGWACGRGRGPSTPQTDSHANRLAPLRMTELLELLIGAAGARRERRELVRIYVPLASQHQAEAIKIEIDNRRSEERERLAHDEAADNGDA